MSCGRAISEFNGVEASEEVFDEFPLPSELKLDRDDLVLHLADPELAAAMSERTQCWFSAIKDQLPKNNRGLVSDEDEPPTSVEEIRVVDRAARCSSPITYPEAAGPEYPLVLFVAHPKTVNRRDVIMPLRDSGLIEGKLRPTGNPKIFSAAAGQIGHYEVTVGRHRCTAHLVPYEPEHIGHAGCFVPGQNSFVCGVIGGEISGALPRLTTCGTPRVLLSTPPVNSSASILGSVLNGALTLLASVLI